MTCIRCQHIFPNMQNTVMCKKRKAVARSSEDTVLMKFVDNCIHPNDSDVERPMELLQSAYDCSVCLSLLVDPVVGQCGHDFCKLCLDEWCIANSSSGMGVKCPLCRQFAIAPGVSSLGVCKRLQNLIESAFPKQVAIRRKEIETRICKLEARKRKAVDEHQNSFGVGLPANNNEGGLDVNPSRFPRSRSLLEVQSRTVTSVISNYSNAVHPIATPIAQALQSERPQSNVQSGLVTDLAPSHMTRASSATTWRCSREDAADRRNMVQRLLQGFRSHPALTDEGLLSRLPRLVAKIEAVLYLSAESKDVYLDLYSLRSRICNSMKNALNQNQ
ncbi:hypothetical protein CEUSTIGMA_g5121.t1 [Chlamydomonas eustigma]|uniref:RING-type domain-containing protein n=1 Tax=Chlamydomonas eustigma TaxID=1157962 RepID=A0A250X3N0_9CHLO|nr:hypothetical protein CEUSTIGMA_g5121.t1 [Chlamydomonas eustigma]|eukprot:GAX77678.1 hypothetical protein CEUSTIGMA_g5121.t1 [Chlamydomonas eustigma]